MRNKCEWKDGTLEKCDNLNLVSNRDLPDITMEFCPYCKKDLRDPKLQIMKSNDTWVTHDSGIDYVYFGEKDNAEDIYKYDIDRVMFSSDEFLHYSYGRCWKSFTGDNPDITELTSEICKLWPIVIQLAFCPPYREGTHRVAWGLCGNYVITTIYKHFDQLAIVKCNLRLATFHELQKKIKELN